jgi:DNA-binding beta-propeller fold protein YncE
MRLRSAVGGDRSRGGWPRRWLLGVVLAVLALFVLPATALAAGSVYVTDVALPGISQYSIGAGGALSPLSPPTVSAGPSNLAGPTAIAVSPDGKSAYATCIVTTDTSVSAVCQYNVDPLTGALSPKTPLTVAAGSLPFHIAVAPNGKSVYVADEGDPIHASAVSQYSVDPVSGALSPMNPATVAAGSFPEGVAVSPDSKSAYVVDSGDNAVSQYNIDPVTGALSPKFPATVATGTTPREIAVSPNGKSVYVTNANDVTGAIDNTVSQYDVGAGGTLTPKLLAKVPTGRGPLGIAVSPDGKSVYVANSLEATVSQYDVGAGGALTAKTPATVATGIAPLALDEVAVSPDGTSVYVTDFHPAVTQFSVDPSSGGLSLKTPASVATGPLPEGIAVSPLPRVHATGTSVSCSPSVFAPGDATVCRAAVTDTASSGQSTPTGTVSFTNSEAGRFFGSPCTLSGSGASASCAVFFTSFPRGGQGITASYGGDATHSPSASSTIVLVAVPASTAGCVVFGHGRITAANGDRASFRGLVAALPSRGVEFFRDNGPASAFRVASTSVDALTCSDDATKASVFGTAKVNGAGSVEYRIDVQLTAWEWGKDTYRIRLSNGYDSGAQQIRHGDVDIRIRDRDHHHHDANADHYKPGAGPDGG